MQNEYTKVLYFWFQELTPSDWWIKSEVLDRKIKDRFSSLHEKACQGELSMWRKTALGRLAEIILIDQFSRNIYRDSPKAFSHDSMALTLTQEMMSLQLDKSIPKNMRSFCYMPLMHSESKEIHKQALKIFQEFGSNIDFELKHKEIIDRFGRYPHRNNILKRKSSNEEIEFLKGPDSSF